MTSTEAADAARFLSWQRAVIEVPWPGSVRHTIGPFEVQLSTRPGGFNWATLVDAAATEASVREHVGPLRDLFARHGADLEVELNEGALPEAGAWLDRCGFVLVERNPLMACDAQRWRPSSADEVRITTLDASTDDGDLDAFQRIRWTEGNLGARIAPPVESLRREMSSPGGVYLLAWLDGEPAGTGVSHALGGAAEIVGIVTRADKRRRGVAATVSSELLRRHFGSGGDFAFLDAANDDAERIYKRLGFTGFGANAVYAYRPQDRG